MDINELGAELINAVKDYQQERNNTHVAISITISRGNGGGNDTVCGFYSTMNQEDRFEFDNRMPDEMPYGSVASSGQTSIPTVNERPETPIDWGALCAGITASTPTQTYYVNGPDTSFINEF